MRRLFGYLVALLALLWMAHRLNSTPGEWLAVAKESSPGMLAVAAFCFVAHVGLNARAFCSYVASECANTDRSTVRLAWRDSLLAKYLPGGLWQIAGRWLLLERAGVSRSSIAQASVFEQGLALSLCALLGCAFYLVAWAWEQSVVICCLTVAAAAALGWLILRLLGYLSVRFMPAILRLFNANAETVHRAALSHMARTMALAMFPFVLGYMLVFWPLLGGVSDALHLAATVFLSTWIGLIVLFVPGGLGIRESSMTLLFVPHSTNGVAVLSFAVLARILLMLAEVLTFALMDRFRVRKARS